MRRIVCVISALVLPIASIAPPIQSVAIETCSNSQSAITCASNRTPANTLASIELPVTFQYPNGIAHTSNGTLYVGSITSGQILLVCQG